MHIILGATGHIGSAVAQCWLERHEPITLVLHKPDRASEWQQRGARTVVADVHDTAALHDISRTGQRLLPLNPSAAPSTAAAAEERKSLAFSLAALPESGLRKIVAESTYGAQPGDSVGDMGVLYAMEQGLAAQPIPASIIRAACHMSNWEMGLVSARQGGKVHSLYPADCKLPMLAPPTLRKWPPAS